MERPDIDLSELGTLWSSPSDEEADQLLSELHAEAPRGHLLEGVHAEPVAVKKLLKDVILWLPDRAEWARVHLTYAPETDPRYPTTVIESTWERLLADIRRGRSRNDADLHEQIEALLFSADPMGINFEDNTDEYDPEARTILKRLPSAKSEAEVVRIVHEEFVRWFDKSIAHDAHYYRDIGADIWRLWQLRADA